MRKRLRRPWRVAAVGVVALAAVVVRLPLILATRPLGFDDGVYATSVMAMRSGAQPFHDIFSSQGPVFLPTLRVFDLIGFEQPWAPRLAMVAAGIVIAVSVFSVAERLASTLAAAALGIAAATSVLIIYASGPLQSDGLALAFGAAAFAVSLRENSGRGTAISVGVIAALALATKSLLVMPAVVAAFVVLWRRRSASAVVMATLSGIATGLVVALPFGLNAVWDQYVLFHFDVPRLVAPVDSLSEIVSGLTDKDFVVVSLGLVAVAGWVLQRHNAPSGAEGERTIVIAAWTWLVTLLVILIFTTDLGSANVRYMAFLIVPILVLAASAPLPRWVVVAVVLALLPFQLAHNGALLDGSELEPDELLAVKALDALPAGSYVVGDAPSLTYAAGLPAPFWLTDTS